MLGGLFMDRSCSLNIIPLVLAINGGNDIIIYVSCTKCMARYARAISCICDIKGLC